MSLSSSHPCDSLFRSNIGSTNEKDVRCRCKRTTTDILLNPCLRSQTGYTKRVGVMRMACEYSWAMLSGVQPKL